MRKRVANISRLLLATMGAFVFYGVVCEVTPLGEPHPGLRDDELQSALRKNWNHNDLSYYEARKHLWGSIDGDGRSAEGTYTGKTLEYYKQPLPNTGSAEHAWPLTRLPAEGRSDLHHMYAVDGEARLARLNLHYGKVFVPVWSEGGSKAGPSSKVKPVFEVRQQRRGDIARSMFYVATMYDLDIPDAEEKELRKWHKEDPVDRHEQQRNDRVAAKQTSRNPFVDHPGLTKRISDF